MHGELAQLSCVHEYEVIVARRPDKDQLEAWKRNVVLANGYKMHKQRYTEREFKEKVLGYAWL
jgi:hypothetical protein